MSKRDIIAISGFLLFLLGFMTLILGMVGVQFVFFSFLERINGTASILIKLAMIVCGFILIFQSKTTVRK